MGWVRVFPAFLVAFLFAGNAVPPPAFGKYIQLDAVADIKTRFSAGCSSVQELANIAQHRGIDVVIYSDRDRISLEYGIAPFERIIKKKKEQSSILTLGAATYLSEINANDKNFPDTLLIPAVESAPFYFWTGNPLDKDLTAHDWDKHLLIIGLEHAKDYEQLPILNSNFSKKYLHQFMPLFLAYVGLALAAAGLFYKKFYRKTSFFFIVVFSLLAVNNHPFKSSPFNQYQGNQGIKPYQELIDYAVSNGAMVFWNHMESTAGMGRKDSVGLKTLPHAEDLLLTSGYTGFQAVYDGLIHITDPGKEWDQALVQYTEGERARPVWGYGGNDFHCEGKDGRRFGGVRTILLVREKTREAVLDALRNGRMYALRQPDDFRLSLDTFTVSDKAARKEATMGEELVSKAIPEIKIKIRSTNGAEEKMMFSLIRNGKLIKQKSVFTPYELVWRDVDVERKGLVYYRLIAKVTSKNYLVSNPIFVNFSEAATEVASLPPQPKELLKDQTPTAPKPPKPPKEPEAKLFQAKQPKIPKVDRPISPDAPEMFTPDVPKVAEPAQPKTGRKPTAPVSPQPAQRETGQKFVVALIDGVALKKGPGVKFPQIATARKGERLLLIRKLSRLFNGKPWLEVKKGGHKMFVWEGLVKDD